MSRSKATAALMRLKEMDRKYNIKRNESKRPPGNVSTESSPDSPQSSPRNPRLDPKGITELPMKSNLDRETSDVDISAKDDNVNGSSEFPGSPARSKLEVKIPHVRAKNESKVKGFFKMFSDIIMNNNESSSPVEVKTNPEVEENDGNFAIKTVESSVYTVTSESSDNSEIDSVAKSRSTADRKDTDAPEAISPGDNIRENNGNDSGGSKHETTIDEISGTGDERSEIISELSNVLDGEIPSVRAIMEASSRLNDNYAGAPYESDTFEDVSSSSVSSTSKEEQIKTISTSDVEDGNEDTVRSGIKGIKIIPHKTLEVIQKKLDTEKAKQIVELVAPKITQSTSECEIGLDEELSNYVKSMENAENPHEVPPICLLKSTRQTSSPRRQTRKARKHGKPSRENESKGTIASPVVSSHGRSLDDQSGTEKSEERVSSGKSSHAVISRSKGEENTPRKKKSVEEHTEKVSEERRSSEERGEATATGSEEKSLKTEVADEYAMIDERFLKEIPEKSDVTMTLRKLNRDAIDAIARRRKMFEIGKSSCGQCRNCGTFVRLHLTSETSKNVGDENDISQGNVKSPKHSSRGKRTKLKMKGAKSVKSRKLNQGKTEEKCSRFDCRQTHQIRKQAAMLRLQQEREDIRKCLVELERTRIDYQHGEPLTSPAAIKPLDFPKIASYVRPDDDLKTADEIVGIQERVCTIRQWLKDQYVLYRDYSSLAQTLNAKYVPASLEDAKKTIRQLQKATIKTR